MTHDTPEFDVIARHFTRPAANAVLGVGDDCALVDVSNGMDLAVSVDTMVSGTHFFPDVDPETLGHKSLAVNLSDLAAMGARPGWATLSLALPQADADWLERFSLGFLELARAHDVDLIGGDTTRGPLAICVQIMGEVAAGKALRRSGARAGDDLWVSGTLGDAAIGLAHLHGDFELRAHDRDHALKRLDLPQPRVALGQALVGVATGAIDISDGLIADVGHVAEASGVRAVIEWESVPLSSAAESNRQHPVVRRSALAGGDDYELAFTAPSSARRVLGQLGAQLGVPLTRIGHVEAGEGVIVLDKGGNPLVLPETGFDHFR
jgi:thiamine-monophosphate kinase